MRTSSVIETILEILQEEAEATADLFDIFTSDYATSRRKIARSLKYGPRRFKTNWAEVYRNRQKFFNLLNHLKRQGLVESKKEGRRSIWKITAAGLGKLKLLKQRNLYSKQSTEYESTENEAALKIITYDIPVREGHKKRDWLRAVLANLGFTLLQKSVWVGKRKIPEAFLNDLHERKLLPYVHVFTVAKSGTIKEIT